MILLKVWIETACGEHLHVGFLACGDPDAHGRYESQFAYSDLWRARQDGFDLLPKGLERAAYSFAKPARCKNLEPPLSVFEDAAPDTWGRKLLVRLRKLPPAEQSLPYLLREVGPDGLGALSFSVDESPLAPRRASARTTTLAELLQAAEDFEAGRLEKLSPKLERLLMAQATPGGARPKAVVQDEAGAGWIAKFPSRSDAEGAPARGIGEWDIVALEATCMRLARNAGLDVPDTRLQSVGHRKALLVRRFDLNPTGGRNHMVSLRTLCGERPGSEARTYRELYAEVVDASCRPQADVEMLFRHMTMNAAIGNTDDHLKNFWILRDEEGWKLSPAIDLVPAGLGRREHQLAFLYDYTCPRGTVLIEAARDWRIRPSKARSIIADVLGATEQFEKLARSLGVRADNIPEIDTDLKRRRNLLADALVPSSRPKEG